MGIYEECKDFYTEGYCDRCLYSQECRSRYEENMKDARRTVITKEQRRLE